MTDHRQQALDYLQEHKAQALEKMKALISIPSVSTDPEREDAIQQAAEWLKDELSSLGMTRVEIFPTPRHPIVYAENLSAGKDKPTALIYGHYDVQPVDPIDEWNSDPFTPTEVGDYLYARGATDMKGQIIATLSAIESIQQTGDLPLNVKFLIEGEEEIGGSYLQTFIKEHAELLSCDFFLNPDTGMQAPDLPTITYALRGIAYFELRVQGPKQDLHSGTFGGAIHNPAQVMTDLLSGLHDQKGRVTLKGFYDKVLPLDAEEREELKKLPIAEDFYLQQAGVKALWGEEGYTAVERTGARPTLEINGLYSGFIGEGQKTVLPAYAMAKVSCRLVPNQDPVEVYEQFKAYLEENAPPTVTWELIQMSKDFPSISDRKSKWIEAYVQAAEAVWGKKPIFKREGGSVPVVVHVQQTLGVDSVNIGFSMPGDNMHAPNEKIHLPTFYKGSQALVHFFLNAS
ncbi:MAG: dipeptidase [Anaerolineales bacterium]|jgi:acetylornithine deacetylase/succinyl-diaminopimelate desuccinylase-like protein